MSEESTGEKRFDPTPKKKRDAALKGDTLHIEGRYQAKKK